jgi:hypothetical protein
VESAHLGVARGEVYLISHTVSGSSALRVALDGTGPSSGPVTAWTLDMTGNDKGVMATAEGHPKLYGCRVNVLRSDFTLLTHVDAFTPAADERTGNNAPCSVVVGDVSSDFYALDQHVPRVVRLNSTGIVGAVPLPGLGATGIGSDSGDTGDAATMRISESRGRIYTAWPSGCFSVADLTGKQLWPLSGVTPQGQLRDAYDVDPDGKVHILAAPTKPG